ncbi:Hypothetical_protein [Hexamita inflata]|uniref:Hypothetical_protein n=1 Tax=Hexamita inflata TaxID=28002 RepID=A0ABP1GZW1_9EUKA
MNRTTFKLKSLFTILLTFNLIPKYLQTCKQPCKHVKLIYFPQSVGYHIYHQHNQNQIVLNTYLDFYYLQVSPTVTFCSQMFSDKYYHYGLEKIQYRLESSYIHQNVISEITHLMCFVTTIPSLVSWVTLLIANRQPHGGIRGN